MCQQVPQLSAQQTQGFACIKDGSDLALPLKKQASTLQHSLCKAADAATTVCRVHDLDKHALHQMLCITQSSQNQRIHPPRRRHTGIRLRYNTESL